MFKIKSTYLILIKLLILSLFAQGWMIAIFKQIGIQGAFNFGSFFTFLLFGPVILYHFKIDIKNRFATGFLLLLLLFCLSLLLKLSLQSGSFITNYSIGRSINYILPIVLVLVPAKLSEEATEDLTYYLNRLFNISIIIGILQPFLFGIIPDFFVDPPLVVKDDVFAQSRIYLGTKIFSKPNGLIGNPIEYADFLMSALIFKLFLISKRTRRDMFFIIVLLITNFLTFSRFSLVFSVFLMLIYLYNVRIISLQRVVFFIISLSLLFVFLNKEILKNEAVVYSLNRLTGRDISASGSNTEHVKDYIAVANLISENPIGGIPIGQSAGENQVITDGAWFKMLLEFGIPIFLIFSLILIYILLGSLRISFEGERLFLYMFFLFFFFANFVNSGFFSKINYSLFWLLLGLNYNRLKLRNC